jgi:ubiquinone/menaquinone biosynthesis C-methylase UbiE
MSERARPRLSRTLARARWREYEELLEAALAAGYRIVGVEDWLDGAAGHGERTLILRHDVDQHPRSALSMAAIEREVGVRSTWYFRWRTADPSVIARLRADGFQVGLHYETLTRAALENGSARTPSRKELACEVAAFQRIHGPIRSIAPHGDSRLPQVNNGELTRESGTGGLWVEFDGNEAMAQRRPAVWLTDRSSPEGGWADGFDPHRLLEQGETPILCLTHPNNWVSGAGLWLDRGLSTALPSPPPGRPARPLRTRGDAPPTVPGDERGPAIQSTVPLGRELPELRDFAPIASSLQKELVAHYERERAEEPGPDTIATNSALVERRAEALMAMIAARGLSVRGRPVLDLGCGFGALSLFFAAQGARVVAVDLNAARMGVGRAVAEEHGLTIRFRPGSMEDLPVKDRSFVFAVMNNSLCYITDRAARATALSEARRALRPGGLLLVRNPNRLYPVDQFTGLPLVGMLPRRAGQAVARVAGKQRSKVVLRGERQAADELRASGFEDVRAHAQRPGTWRAAARPMARYQHLSARKPSHGRIEAG